MDKKNVKKIVRDNYGNIAKTGSSCCSPTSVKSCCGDPGSKPVQLDSMKLGYSAEELSNIPEGANLGLGCGNPIAHASLKEGETYLDLGSGAGIDCFLASQKVGKTGKVIGIDMTPEMLDKARENARNGGYENVEFRLGEIEHLPVADNSVDVITSNCVINLSSDKFAVFSEAFRVLKPGGRLMISDIVLLKELPISILNSIEAYVGCVAGAMIKDEYLRLVEKAGFKDIKINSEDVFAAEYLFDEMSNEEVKDFAQSVVSIKFSAVKPNLAMI